MQAGAQNLHVTKRVTFARDWKLLNAASTDRASIESPARFYLYSLMASGFIRLHNGDSVDANKVLDALARLDMDDQVGGSVIMMLAASFEDDESSVTPIQ